MRLADGRQRRPKTCSFQDKQLHTGSPPSVSTDIGLSNSAPAMRCGARGRVTFGVSRRGELSPLHLPPAGAHPVRWLPSINVC
jgi:hypothetical protein